MVRHDAGETRHLLRALLRESTYLPDSAARRYVRQHVLSRFKANHEKGNAKELVEATAAARQRPLCHVDATRAQRSLSQGRKALGMLQRANRGELKPLTNVLLHTYGRAGKRRYELMKPLFEPDVPANTDAVLALRAAVASPDVALVDSRLSHVLEWPTIAQKGRMKHYTLSTRLSKLHALLDSQAKASPMELRRPKVRSVSLQTPAENLWGRTMPRKREKNILRNWYAALLNRILPPLPEHEWNRLEGLVTGKRSEGIKERRPGRSPKPDELRAGDLTKLVLADGLGGGIGGLDRACRKNGLPGNGSREERIFRLTQSNRYYLTDRWLADEALVQDAGQEVLEDGIGVRTLNKTLPGREGPHNITPRFMRRLWAKVFTQCPMMVFDRKPNKWIVTWGKYPTGIGTADPPESSSILFAGVNSEGRT